VRRAAMRRPRRLADVPGQRRQSQHGRAMQVDPMKPKLKPPRTKRLKLEYDGLLSEFGFKFNLRKFGFKFNLRRYNTGFTSFDNIAWASLTIFQTLTRKAERLFRTCTRPTLNLLLSLSASAAKSCPSHKEIMLVTS